MLVSYKKLLIDFHNGQLFELEHASWDDSEPDFFRVLHPEGHTILLHRSTVKRVYLYPEGNHGASA